MRFRIKAGRNVTLKMGTGHPGYEFGLDEIGTEDAARTAAEWVAAGAVEDISPEPEPEPVKEPEPIKELEPEKVPEPVIAEEEPEPEPVKETEPVPEKVPTLIKRGRGRPSGSGAKRK